MDQNQGEPYEKDENIIVGLEDITPGPNNIKSLPAKLHIMRALVSHLIAGILVICLCLSVVLYSILLCKYPEQGNDISEAFEKWYAVISPFAGLALGAYYGSSKKKD